MSASFTLHGAGLYRIPLETVTIAASPFRQGCNMPTNATATQTAAEQGLYRIGEVSRLTNLKPFVLRYWETEFPMLEPVKSASGHRLYRQQDVDMIFRIKRLLYDEGFTIAGARRHLRDPNGASDADAAALSSGGTSEGASQLLSRKMLLDLRDSLRAFLTLLERR
jgi:DNA-binding transcriptional MerR regulator